MKIIPKDIDLFIKNIPEAINAILLYGVDSGLVNIRANSIINSYIMVGKFKYEQLKNNASSLLDCLHSIKLFDEDLSKKKLAIIECSGISIAEPILSIITNVKYKGLILFYAGELGTDSSLRKVFEKLPHLAAIPCYLDDQKSLVTIIQQVLKDYKITYESGVLQLLSNSLPCGNRVLIINELEKIVLFLGDKKNILVSDLENYLHKQGEISFDKLCYQLSLREVDEIEELLLKLLNQGHNLVQIIRMVIYHFNRLHQVKCLIEQGKSEQQSIASLYPPIFFKQVENFNKSLTLWKKEQLIKTLMDLTAIELSTKQNSTTALTIFKQMILMIKSK